MYDLEGSNNVDPLVSGFGSIYWTVKYICPVNLLSVLIFSKQTRACRGHPSSKHVCSTARLTARPHALRPCARQPRGCHCKWHHKGSLSVTTSVCATVQSGSCTTDMMKPKLCQKGAGIKRMIITCEWCGVCRAAPHAASSAVPAAA